MNRAKRFDLDNIVHVLAYFLYPAPKHSLQLSIGIVMPYFEMGSLYRLSTACVLIFISSSSCLQLLLHILFESRFQGTSSSRILFDVVCQTAACNGC